MPIFLFHGTYINEGIPGLVHDGGSNRDENIRAMIEKLGGTCKCVYFGLETDAYAIAEMPNDMAAVALTLTWNASGRINVASTPLLTPKQMDQATNMHITEYRAPGK
jgi:uncharacterized protein with GYD domain